MSIGKGRLQHDCYLLPLLSLDFDFLLYGVFSIGVDQLDRQLHRRSIGCAGIDREAVFLALLQADATVAFIIDAGTQQATVVDNTDVVRIAVEARFLVFYRYLSEGNPPNKRLRELERTVLHQFGIQASVGSEIDVLEKDTVHGRLYLGCRFGDIHRHCVLSLYAQSQ